jgi:hypothetical protein
VLYDAEFQLVDLGKQLKPIIESFQSNEAARRCQACGTLFETPPRS